MSHPVLDLTRQSLSDPRNAVRTLIGWRLPWAVLANTLLLSSALGGILFYVLIDALLAVPPEGISADDLAELRADQAGPFRRALGIGIGTIVNIVAVWGVGRMLGGKGGLHASAATVIWHGAVTLVPLAAAVLLLLLSPPLGGLVLLAVAIFNIWLATNFIAELHGFRSAWSVFLVMVMIGFGLALLVMQVSVIATSGSG